MKPYEFVKQATEQGESLLSLCAGIGLELQEINSKDITAVDIVPEYLEKLKADFPEVRTVCRDALSYLRTRPNKSVDVISIIDGIEHMEKPTGLAVIRQMKRVAKKQILLFTPQGRNDDGFVRNEPHHAWDIPTGDEHQTHKSGWTLHELQELGFKLLSEGDDISQHGEPYRALMMEWHR